MPIKSTIAVRSFLVTLLLTHFLLPCTGQEFSENGWVLPTKGEIRVLAVFVEIDYSGTDQEGLFSKGTNEWPVGELPRFKDDLFNPHQTDGEWKTMTEYYHEISFGNLSVLGDYYPKLIVLDGSAIGRGRSRLLKAVVEELNQADTISASGLPIEAFDLWQNTTRKGETKVPSEGFEGIDHLMVILRNFPSIPNGQGQASSSSAGKIRGRNTDSYSIFGAGDGLPFTMFRHEFNHLLIGGNNFHAGGGNAATFRSYNFFVQGGWSMMGAANSSFLTCSGWDRYWLGWKPEEKTELIMALDEKGEPIRSDLDGEDGVFILRDFVTTGDVLRIRLPYIPDPEFSQWIWVENHTTQTFNGSRFDVFHYEWNDCIEDAKPGLYLYRQIDADLKRGEGIYQKVHADYLKPLPAEGAYDMVWDKEKTKLEACINSLAYRAYELKDNRENPLTGAHTLEFPIRYEQGDVKVDGDDAVVPGLRRKGDEYIRLPYLGHPENGFREGEKRFMGLGTNPSTASVITNLNRKKKRSDDKRNSDRIYLNGISLEIIETYPDRSIKVRVSTADSVMSENRRWCGPDIILNDHNPEGADLVVSAELRLDRGETLTRFNEPDTLNGITYFTSPTVLRVSSGTTMRVSGEVSIEKDSRLVVEAGGRLILDRKSAVSIYDTGVLVLEEGAMISGRGKIKVKEEGSILVSDKRAEDRLKSFTCQKRAVRITPSEAEP